MWCVCAIKYHVHSLKNVKNTHGGGLKPATLLKVTILLGCFSHFLNCTNGTKMCKAPDSPFYIGTKFKRTTRLDNQQKVQKPFWNQLKHASLAGKLEFYSKYWVKLTHDGNVLFVVQDFKIPILQTSFQIGPPQITSCPKLSDFVRSRSWCNKIEIL